MNLFQEYPFEVACKLILSEQLMSRLSFLIPNRHFPVHYPGGRIYLNLKEYNPGRNKALGVYEYWKTRLIMQIVKSGMTFIDVGVNKGYFSFLAARLMNDKGTVISFEPDAQNCHWIQKGITINQYTSVKLFQTAIADANGSMTFYPGRKSGWGSLFLTPHKAKSERNSITVRTRRLDDILEEQGIDQIDILKIDVEGADLLVLKGAEKILDTSKNARVIMDIDVRSDAEKKQLFDLLTSRGFRIFRIGRQLIPIHSIEEAGKDIYACKQSPRKFSIGDE